MILDSNMLFADALAYNGTTTVLDLGNATPGPGEDIDIFFTGSSDLAGCTGITFTTGSSSSASTGLMTITGNPAGATWAMALPSNTLQFVKLALVGTVTAGSFSAGVSLDGIQTNV